MSNGTTSEARMEQASTAGGRLPVTDVVDYDWYLRKLQARFTERVADGTEPLFTTDAVGLFEEYLAAIPEAERQYYTCHACRDFVRRFGGLVTIDATGRKWPLFWDPEEAPALLRGATAAVEQRVRRAKVTGVFLSSLPVWGQPVTGEWHHLAVTPPAGLVYRAGGKDAHQAAAEKHEDYLQVTRALAEFPEAVLQQAMTLLEADQLYRSEKILGPVRWLRDLRVAWARLRGPARANLVWRAVALAPAGFCHPRSGMAGTLLEDLAAGLSFAEVSRRFAAKMHPLRYQRPQAAPAAGNIEQAEKVVERLGLRTALQRRFARLEEVQALWRPAPVPVAPAGGGVFGHLQAKGAAPAEPLRTPAVTMTWEKFRRTVLPNAQTIELFVRAEAQPFMALVTATDPGAPPLLQWDSPERRNPVSWYFWSGGSPPAQWGLRSGWTPVAAVALFPCMWGPEEERFAHHAKGVTFFLAGARETRQGGLGLFPEMLRAELHGIRATIEAFSRAGEMADPTDGSACGIGVSSGNPRWQVHLRVRTAAGVTEYLLDRWD